MAWRFTIFIGRSLGRYFIGTQYKAHGIHRYTQEFLTSGPDHLKPVGETIFVKKIADEAKKEPSKSQISGIVSHADRL